MQTTCTKCLGWMTSLKGSWKLRKVNLICRFFELAIKSVVDWKRHRFGLKIFHILFLFFSRALILLDFNRQCKGLLTFFIILKSQHFLWLLQLYCICLYLAKPFFFFPLAIWILTSVSFFKKEGYKWDQIPKLTWAEI